ncbi:unnamed protein product [Calypogeia fissa]
MQTRGAYNGFDYDSLGREIGAVGRGAGRSVRASEERRGTARGTGGQVRWGGIGLVLRTRASKMTGPHHAHLDGDLGRKRALSDGSSKEPTYNSSRVYVGASCCCRLFVTMTGQSGQITDRTALIMNRSKIWAAHS